MELNVDDILKEMREHIGLLTQENAILKAQIARLLNPTPYVSTANTDVPEGPQGIK